MTKRFPLLDGTTLDLEEAWPYPWHNPSDVYKEGFNEEANPWWLSLTTDNGSQTFSGLVSAGGLGETTLKTGTTNTGDTTVLETNSLNWDNWEEVWFAAINTNGQINQSNSTAEFHVSWGDNKNPNSITEGFYWQTQTGNQAGDFRIVSGGTNQIDANAGGDKGQMYGFRLWENPDNGQSNGHSIVPFFDWEPKLIHAEDDGWPSSGERSLRVGITTQDTAANRTADIDKIVFALA